MALRTALLPTHALARLARLRLQAVGARTARGRGEHVAGRGGVSTDIADHRDYADGDDLRHLDWNAFARLGRPYLRLYRREEERHLVLIVDDSRSMACGAKAAMARRLAAGFALAGVHGDERVSLLGHAGERLPPTRGRAGLARCLGAIEALDEPGARRDLDRLCADAAARGRRGIAVVISDFLMEGDPARSLHRLSLAGLEPWAVQVLDRSELDPEAAGDVALVDAETAAVLEVGAERDLLRLYHGERERLAATLAAAARARAGRFLAVAADDDPVRLLTVDLVRLGWLA